MRNNEKKLTKKAPKLVRPRFWLSLLILLLLLVAIGLGQWDWALAAVIGLFLGNGLSALFEKGGN